MEWWNSFVAWLFSNDVARVFNAVVFPTLAILIAGVVYLVSSVLMMGIVPAAEMAASSAPLLLA